MRRRQSLQLVSLQFSFRLEVARIGERVVLELAASPPRTASGVPTSAHAGHAQRSERRHTCAEHQAHQFAGVRRLPGGQAGLRNRPVRHTGTGIRRAIQLSFAVFLALLP